MNALSKLFEVLHLSRGEMTLRRSHRRRRARRHGSALSCETLEPKQLLAADVAVQFSDLVFDTTDPTTVAIEGKFQEDTVSGTVVKFDTNAPVSDSNIYIELTSNTPLTNANFLSYVDSNAYDNTFFHRSVNNFVLQGGGFTAPTVPADQPLSDPLPITTTGTVQNEPGNPNVRGTIAMAKLGGDPDSATSQFFFNIDDNNLDSLGNPGGFLDSDNGGYTVFGDVLGSGMTAIDLMNNALTYDASAYYANTGLDELPLYNRNDDNIVRPQDFLKIENADVVTESDLMTYVVSSSDAAKLTASFDGNGDLVLTPVGSASGSVTVTVTATSKLDNLSDSQTFSVQLNGGGPVAPVLTAIEEVGNTVLSRNTTGALYASGSTVLYGGSALTTDRFADRTIVGADTIDGTNYIVFQFTTGSYAGTYRHWAYNASWSAPTGSSWTPTASDSATWAFENAFGINFDGQFGVGTPPTTAAVETAGDVELARDTSTNALYASGSTVLYGGAALTTDRFADRTIVGADTIDGTNYIVFQFRTGSYAGTYRHWAYNASWSAPTGSSWTPTASDSATWAFENAFGINFDGQFGVGTPPTTAAVETAGDVELARDTSTNALYASGSTVLYGGAALTTDRFADRTIVGADTIDGTNYIVFQFTTGSYAGTYRHWAYNASWSAPTGSSWTPTASDSATWAFENAFGINFDGLNGIGVPQTPTTSPVETAGDVELARDTSTNALYASGSTVLYGGAALTTDRFADRTIVGADTIDGTNYIVFQFTTGSYAGTYRHWAYNASWSAPTGSSWTPTASDSATWAFENAFGINFDGLNGIGVPQTPTTSPVETAGDVELARDTSTNALYASGSTVLYGGSALTTDRFADRTIVGADTIDGTNYIVFQFTTGSYAGTYRHWAYNASWSAPTGSSWTPTASDSATWAFENAFGINFDGQFGVGTPPTTAAVETAGDVELARDTSTNALYASGSTVLYGGAALTTDRFADRTIVGADTIDGTNYIVFQFTTGSYAGTYRHWAYNASWSAPTGSSWTPTASDSATWAFENAFGINFDGLNGIGN